MPLIVRSETPIEKAYNALTPELFALGREWQGNDADISFPTRDLVHHVSHALLIEHEFEQADHGDRVLAHEAFLSVISMAQVLERAHDEQLAPPAMLERTRQLVVELLDAMTPHVSRADAGVRATIVDGVPFDEVVAALE